MEHYEHLRHNGPDYSHFLQVEVKEKLIDALLDWLMTETFFIFRRIGILCDVVESIKREKVIIYTCPIEDKDDKTILEGCAMLNALKLDNPKELDQAINYLLKFIQLIKEEHIHLLCQTMFEINSEEAAVPVATISNDFSNIIEEKEYEISIKTLDEIFNLITSNQT